MIEQNPAEPVAGPPAETPAGERPSEQGPSEQVPGHGPERPFADLEHRPVAEHVAVYETEHARLQQELSSIDQL